MATTVTEDVRGHDFIAREWHPGYSRKVVTFLNNTGATASFAPGLVLEASGANYIDLATAANAAAILLTQVNDLADTGTQKVVVLIRGPVIVNDDKLNYSSPTGGAAAARTALEALSPPIVVIDEPASVQDGPGT